MRDFLRIFKKQKNKMSHIFIQKANVWMVILLIIKQFKYKIIIIYSRIITKRSAFTTFNPVLANKKLIIIIKKINYVIILHNVQSSF